MKLYYGLTLYHVLSCILHKITFNTDKECDLIISSLTVNYENLAKTLKESKIFQNVLILDDKKIVQERIKRSSQNETLGVLEKIKNNNVELEKQIKNLEEYKEIYLCADHFPLGIYLNSNKIRYNYFEDGPGQQCKVEQTIESSIKAKNKFLYDIIVYLNLFGRSKNVNSRYIDLAAQVDLKEDGILNQDFSVSKILSSLDDNKKNKVLKIFNVSLEKINAKNKVLFLPQHNVNLNIFSIEQQIEQSALLIDYFLSNKKLVIKPHPNDDYTNYSRYFPEAEIIDRKFPIELMIPFTEDKFEIGLTAWSTSIKSISNILQKSIYFTSEIDKDYNNIHLYYT